MEFNEEYTYWLLDQLHGMLKHAQWQMSDRAMVRTLRNRHRDMQRIAIEQKRLDDIAEGEHIRDLKSCGLY